MLVIIQAITTIKNIIGTINSIVAPLQ